MAWNHHLNFEEYIINFYFLNQILLMKNLLDFKFKWN